MSASVPIRYGLIPLGGGGLLRSIDAVVSGGQLYFVKYGDGAWCHRFYPGDGRWIDINTRITNPVGGGSAWEIRIAPSDPNRMYMITSSFRTLRSDNGGLLFANTNIPQFTNSPGNNGGSAIGQVNTSPAKYMWRTLAIDPVNPDVFYMYWGGAISSGSSTLATARVYRSFDAGVTPEIVGDASGAPITTALTSSQVGAGICFDPSSGTTGGKTNRLIVPAHAAGVWETTDAGSTFNNIAGDGVTTGPVGNICAACMTPDGVYFCYDTATPGASGGTGKLWKYQSGAWSIITGVSSLEYIEANPLQAGTLVCGPVGGPHAFSTNYGASWTTQGTISIAATTDDVANLTGNPLITRIVFDPVTNGKAWLATGIGSFYVDALSGSATQCHCKTKDEESLVCHVAYAPDRDLTLVGVSDRAIYRVFDIDDYDTGLLTTTRTTINDSINHCTMIDYAASDPNFLVAPVAFFNVASQRSYDAGRTWEVLPNLTPWQAQSGNGVTMSGTLTSGQSISGTVRTFFPGEGTVDLNSGTIPFNTSATQTLTDLGNAIVTQDSRLSFSATSSTLAFNTPAVVYSGSDLTVERTPLTTLNFIATGSGTLPTFAFRVNPSGGTLLTGNAVAATPLNYVALAANNALPYYTKDGAVSWNMVPGLPKAITFDNPFLSGQSFSGVINGTPFGPVNFNTSNDQTLTDIVTAILAVAPNSGCRRYSQNGSAPYDSRSIVFFGGGSVLVNSMSVGGSGTKPNCGFHYCGVYINAWYLARNILAADKVNVGTFYMAIWPLGLLRSTDGGDTWAVAKSGSPFNDDGSFWSAWLYAHPTRAGELVWREDFVYTAALKRSVDSGSTWQSVANTQLSFGFGWGRAKTVGGSPSVHYQGTYNGTQGLFHSYDDMQTWSQIATFAELSAQKNVTPSLVAADMNDWTRDYFCSSAGSTFGGANRKWRLSAAA